MVDPEYATMRQQSQEAYDVAVRSKSASDWAHFLQLRKAKTANEGPETGPV
jgi:hypothetical protein